MPLMSFSCENKKQAIVNKECSQTIRPLRKEGYRIEEGDRLYIYWKQRVSPEKKDHHKIGEGRVTETFYPLIFRRTNGAIGFKIVGNLPDSIPVLARKDGFESEERFFGWFMNRYGKDLFGLNFKIIRWGWE